MERDLTSPISRMLKATRKLSPSSAAPMTVGQSQSKKNKRIKCKLYNPLYAEPWIWTGFMIPSIFCWKD